MIAKIMNKKAIIIGSGFGGIASALRLNKLGFKVTLVERLDTLGGRARVFQKEGYRHDAGPTGSLHGYQPCLRACVFFYCSSYEKDV